MSYSISRINAWSKYCHTLTVGDSTLSRIGQSPKWLRSPITDWWKKTDLKFLLVLQSCCCHVAVFSACCNNINIKLYQYNQASPHAPLEGAAPDEFNDTLAIVRRFWKFHGNSCNLFLVILLTSGKQNKVTNTSQHQKGTRWSACTSDKVVHTARGE